MKIIVFAGGAGSCLFPLSRTQFPKQFLKINNEKSLLAQTIERCLPLAQPSDVIVITNPEYIHLVHMELATIGAQEAHVLLEPVARNTAPAIALALRYCIEVLGCTSEEVVYVTPADYLVHPVKTFAQNIRQAIELAKADKLVTLGIPGMFVFSIQRFMDELQAHVPELYEVTTNGLEALTEKFIELPNISMDVAIVEKAAEVLMVPIMAECKDISSWEAIYDVLDKDADGNALRGDCITIECSNTLMLGQSRLIAGIGLEDILVVETDDVIVVAKKGESQKIKALVSELQASGRSEADERTTVYRPWGFYKVLGTGVGYKMKMIVVNPKEILSLQMHYHRSEHWIVIGGTAKVTIGDTEQLVHENESVFVPQTTKHRLENPGKMPLQVIEVQNGSYLGEDDIVRFSDQYGRV